MSGLLLPSGEFARAAQDPDSMVEAMLQQLVVDQRATVGDSEQRSWARSLPVLAEDLNEAGLTGIDVVLEYSLPLTSQRVDAILAGTHPVTGDPSFVVVELKQWSEASVFEGDDALVSVPGYAEPRLHPSRQAAGYRRYLTNFLADLHEHEGWVNALAYLHQVNDAAAVQTLTAGAEAQAPLFTGDRREALRSFLKERLSSAQGSGSAELLLKSRVRPSTKLLTVAAEEVRNRNQFILLGNQQLAVDRIRHEVQRAVDAETKRVIVVSGGPGSGKSAIALSALGELARDGYAVLHATGSRSFTQTMRKVAGYRSRQTQDLFKYFNSFSQAGQDEIDVLIADEAHRIRETSNNRFTRRNARSDRMQIEELVTAARVPVFLLDDNQVVRKGELGSTRDIAAYAQSQGHEVVPIELDEQFRCGGSAAYVEWVEQILGLTAADPAEAALPADDPFVVEVVDSPWELERRLREKNKGGYTARIAAGFCWPWSDPLPSGLVDDVVIDDWARPWNSKEDRRIGGAPPSALWATQDGGFDQIGCVYTAQGFEFDWSGVIIGPDLIWREGRFETVRSANKDPHFRGINKVSDDEFDRLVRHVYKVLLTRGMNGVVLYSPDAQTRDALHALTN